MCKKSNFLEAIITEFNNKAARKYKNFQRIAFYPLSIKQRIK